VTKKIIYIIVFCLFLFQIVFSIIYSNTIVSENQSLSSSGKKLNQLILDNQSLNNKYLKLISLPVLEEYAKSKNYQPITKIIK